MISREFLNAAYVRKRRSVPEIAARLGVSNRQVDYWLAKHGIPKRSISEAIYHKWNVKGDPFRFSSPRGVSLAFLYGLGVGLYWGEGTKRSRSSVRLANSDPALIRAYIAFLVELYRIDIDRLRFGLQIFGDMRERDALRFWTKALRVPKSRFYKTVVTPARGTGTYRHKTEYGVLTVYFNNTRLRDILVDTIAKLSDGEAEIAQLVEHVLGGSQSPAHPTRRR